jgi:hypothetical protein
MATRDEADALVAAVAAEPVLADRLPLAARYLAAPPPEGRSRDAVRLTLALFVVAGTPGRADAVRLLGRVMRELPGDLAQAVLQLLAGQAADPERELAGELLAGRPPVDVAAVLRAELEPLTSTEAVNRLSFAEDVDDLLDEVDDAHEPDEEWIRGHVRSREYEREGRPPPAAEPRPAPPPPPEAEPPPEPPALQPPDAGPPHTTGSSPGLRPPPNRFQGRPPAIEEVRNTGESPGNLLDLAGPVASRRQVAHPRLDAPAAVAPGDELTVTAGLRPDPDRQLVSAGALDDVTAETQLDVALSFDPEAFALLGPGTGPWRLRRTRDDPWPAVDVRLIARRAEGLKPERRVDARFLKDGVLVGFASRAIEVRDPPPAAPMRLMAAAAPAPASAPQPPQPPRPPETPGRIELWPLGEADAPDLTIYVRHADDVAGRRLVFTASSGHADVADAVAPLARSLGDADLGDTPERLGADARLKVLTTTDPEDLYRWLHGFGVRVGRLLPPQVREAVRQAVARSTPGAPASILVLSEEPYVPWELVVATPGWGFPDAGTSPFLGAHAAVGRWVLADVPPPPATPAPHTWVRGTAVVSARYEGIVGWSRLEHAESEAARLADLLGPETRVVPPHLSDVLDLLEGRPAAEVLHFALHGTFDPAGPERGLVLVGERNGRPAAQLLQPEHVLSARLPEQPFVYLNACQVAAGDGRVLGDYGGLAWAFLAAGAGAVVAPLWNVADETASAMAVELYEAATTPGRAGDPDPVSVGEVLRRIRARYTLEAVREGRPGVDAALVSFQLFGHPRLRLRRLPTREATMTAGPTDG